MVMVTVDAYVLTDQARQRAEAQRQRAMTPAVIRAAAWLHAHAPDLPYHSGYWLAEKAEDLRVSQGPGSAVRLLIQWRFTNSQALEVLGILADPPSPKPLWLLFPDWAAMSAEDRVAAWREWRQDPDPVRWVA